MIAGLNPLEISTKSWSGPKTVIEGFEIDLMICFFNARSGSNSLRCAFLYPLLTALCSHNLSEQTNHHGEAVA